MKPRTFGAFLLGESFSRTSLGEFFRAVPLDGPQELRLVFVPAPAVVKTPEAVKLIQRNSKQWSGVRDLHTLNLMASGLVDGTPYAAIEHCPGRLLSALLERSRAEGLPLAPDQSVYLAERLAGALLSQSGGGLFHGALSPESVLVTFEGEVKVVPGLCRDFQTTPLLADPILQTLLGHLPGSLAGGKPARPNADIYALGAIFFQLLQREPFHTGSSPFDAEARIGDAEKGLGPSDALPANLSAILRKSLLPDRPGAYTELAAMKGDLDQLIASGKYSPTTFNIAFLMHSLFRGEDEADASADEAMRTLDRAPYHPKSEPKPEPAPAAPAPPAPIESQPPASPPVEESTFGLEPEPSRKGLFIGLGAAAALLVVVGLVYVAFFRPRGPSKAEIQAQQQLAQISAERSQLKAQQEEMNKKIQDLQQERDALLQKSQTAKTTAEKAQAQKALEEAQKRLKAQQEAQRQLTESGSRPAGGSTQPAALAKESAAPPPAPAPAGSKGSPSAGTTSPAAPESPAEPATAPPGTSPVAAKTGAEAPPAKQTKAGDFVELWAVDARPKQIGELSIRATPLAIQNGLRGTIYVQVTIDETGRVTDAKIVRGLTPDFGMDEVCRQAALRVRYSPALKDGVPVKTNLTYPIVIR
ncbi:MAG: TonB family protein [Acidobacteriota bacterium]